jgi:hypothetical protein
MQEKERSPDASAQLLTKSSLSKDYRAIRKINSMK